MWSVEDVGSIAHSVQGNNYLAAGRRRRHCPRPRTQLTPHTLKSTHTSHLTHNSHFKHLTDNSHLIKSTDNSHLTRNSRKERTHLTPHTQLTHHSHLFGKSVKSTILRLVHPQRRLVYHLVHVCVRACVCVRVCARVCVRVRVHLCGCVHMVCGCVCVSASR